MAKRTKTPEETLAMLNAGLYRGGHGDPYKAQRAAIARRKRLGLEAPRRLFGCDIVNDEPGVFVVLRDGAEVGRAASGREAQEVARGSVP